MLGCDEVAAKLCHGMALIIKVEIMKWAQWQQTIGQHHRCHVCLLPESERCWAIPMVSPSCPGFKGSSPSEMCCQIGLISCNCCFVLEESSSFITITLAWLGSSQVAVIKSPTETDWWLHCRNFPTYSILRPCYWFDPYRNDKYQTHSRNF
jgi:hypothetical protein